MAGHSTWANIQHRKGRLGTDDRAASEVAGQHGPEEPVKHRGRRRRRIALAQQPPAEGPQGSPKRAGAGRASR